MQTGRLESELTRTVLNFWEHEASNPRMASNEQFETQLMPRASTAKIALGSTWTQPRTTNDASELTFTTAPLTVMFPTESQYQTRVEFMDMTSILPSIVKKLVEWTRRVVEDSKRTFP